MTMFTYNLQKTRCTKCGAVDNFETFSRKTVGGTRCLNCGHEKIDYTASSTMTAGTASKFPEYRDF